MDIYREEILEHWRSPQNWGVITQPDVVVEQVNPLCGDEITLYFKIEGGKVADVSFFGSGCAISIASASLLSEMIKGKKVRVLSKLTGEDVLKLLGASKSNLGFPPARLKCAFLALEALRKLKI